MYYIHFISLLCGLFIDIKHVKITWTDTIQASRKFENSKFATIFFNKDFSFNIQSKCLTFSANVDDSHKEGSVSQNLYLGSSFMQSRKKRF